ncbi:unnamed protein product [Cuscuta europaea]|uniref:N-acetyltransferase domain-containing protein n=1 Tax=Cuscuta europaea TaxID=41803 RepID=A0A9P1E4I9_CUSEU|nr:unnamed protein product [Cuscuta europaea]
MLMRYPRRPDMHGSNSNATKQSSPQPSEHSASRRFHARVRLPTKTDVPHLHKLMQQMASYHNYTQVFTATETSISANLFGSDDFPSGTPPFYSATALLLDVSRSPLVGCSSHNVFCPVLKAVDLVESVDDRESEKYLSQEEEGNGGGGVVVAGYVLFYPSYSGYFQSPSIFMENLYVRECYRGIGLGKMLFSAVASKAAVLGFCTIDWLVVGWNEEAIEFYRGMGGQIMADVKRFRLSGEALLAYVNPAAKLYFAPH